MKNTYRVLAFILIAVCILSMLCGCSSIETFTDPKGYPDIFQLAGRVVSGEMYREIDGGKRYNDFASLLFPDTITELNIADYYCTYNHSERFEILLSIQYTPSEYAEEIKRLSAIKHNGAILYTTEHFLYPAYVTALGYNEDCSEYALLDEQRGRIHYIYLQGLRRKDIRMSEDYLPYGYGGYGGVEGINFTIYNTPEVYIPVPSPR